MSVHRCQDWPLETIRVLGKSWWIRFHNEMRNTLTVSMEDLSQPNRNCRAKPSWIAATSVCCVTSPHKFGAHSAENDGGEQDISTLARWWLIPLGNGPGWEIYITNT